MLKIVYAIVYHLNFLLYSRNCKNRVKPLKSIEMYWTLELASKLEDAPWPATKDELIDYAIRSGAPLGG